MAGPIAESSVQIRADIERFAAEMRAGVQASLDRVAADAERTGEDIESAFREAARGSGASLDGIGGRDAFSSVRRNAEVAGESVESSFREAARQSERRLSGIGSAVLGLGALIAGAGLGAGFGYAINQASDLNESLNAVNVTFGDNAEGIHALGSQAANALGLAQNEFNGLAVQFSSFTEKVAGPGGDVVKVMDDLTTRASDFASVMNLDVAEAAAVFQSGLAGETEPLKKFGIDLSAAAVEAYAMANGIGEAGRELTESEKVQARYGALMEQTAQTQGDFANTSDELANGLRILQANAKEAAGTFGQALLPGLKDVVNGLRDLVTDVEPALSALGESVGAALGPLMEAIGPAIATIIPVVGTVIEDLATAFGALTPLIAPLLDIVGLLATTLSGVLADAFVQLEPLVAVVAEFLVEFGAAIRPLLPVIGRLIGGALDLLVPILSQIAAVIGDTLLSLVPVLIDLFDQVFAAVEPLLPVIGELANELLAALVPLLPALVESFAALVPALVAILEALLPLLVPLLQLVTFFVESALAPAITAVAEAFAWLVEVLTGVVTAVAQFVGDVIGWFTDLFDQLVGNSIIPDLVTGIITWFAMLPVEVLRIVGGLVLDVIGWVAQLPGRAAEALASLGASLVGAIGSAAGEMLGRVRTMITDAVGIIGGLVDRAVTALALLGWRLWRVARDAWTEFGEGVRYLVDSAVDLIAGLPQKAYDAAVGFLDRMYQFGRDIIQAVIDGIKSMAGQIASAAASVIPDDITPGFDLPGFGSFAANGMIVNRATRLIAGEAGREVIIPLTRPARARELAQESGLLDLLAGEGGRGRGSDGLVVQFNGGQTFVDGTDANLVAQRTYAAVMSRRAA